MAHRLTNRAIALTVDEDLIPGPEVERPQYGVDRGRCVLYENQVIGAGADEATEFARSIAQCRWQHVAEKPIRICFHFVAPARGGVEHFGRRGAERPVIEEVNPSLELEISPESASELGHRASLAA